MPLGHCLLSDAFLPMPLFPEITTLRLLIYERLSHKLGPVSQPAHNLIIYLFYCKSCRMAGYLVLSFMGLSSSSVSGASFSLRNQSPFPISLHFSISHGLFFLLTTDISTQYRIFSLQLSTTCILGLFSTSTPFSATSVYLL